MAAEPARPPGWARRTAGGWLLAVHVQPGAKRAGVAGLHGERLKIRVAVAAEGGRANAALVEYVAAALGLPRRAVAVTAGARSRDKLLAVAGDCAPGRLLDQPGAAS